MMKSTGPKKTVETVSTVVVTAVYVALVVRSMVPPHQMRQYYMRALHEVETACMRNAQTWAKLADSANRAYDAARLSV